MLVYELNWVKGPYYGLFATQLEVFSAKSDDEALKMADQMMKDGKRNTAFVTKYWVNRCLMKEAVEVTNTIGV